MSTDPAEPRATRRTWAGLALLMLPVLLVSIDNTVLSFALPVITADLHPSASLQLWIVDSYPLVLCSLLVAAGNLGDRIGRRRALLIGMIGFSLASIGAAYAPTAEWVLIARIVMGVFGALILPATHSMLRVMFHDRAQRRLAIAIWSTGFAAGTALGPIIGGWLLQGFGWPAIFLLALPFALPMLVAGPFVLDESRDPEPGPLDPVSVLLSALAIGPVVAAIKHGADNGFDLLSAALVLLGMLAGVLFVRRLNRQANPMLDLGLLRNPGFSGSILVNLVNISAITGFLFFAAQHLQLIAGLEPLWAAWVLVPGAVANILAGLAVVVLVRFARPSHLIAAGLLLAAAAYALIALSGGSPLVLTIAVAYLLIGIGGGFAGTLTGDLMMATIPPEKAGAASAVSETAYELGAVLGVTVFGGILTAHYRAALELPAGLTPAQEAAVSSTLGAAADIAGELPATIGQQVLAAAGQAFDGGVLTTSLIGTVLMVVVAGVALVVLRRQRA